MIDSPRVVKTDAEWEKQLGPEAYRILRAKGTVPTVAGDTHLRLEYVGGEFEVERVTGRANREPILVVVGTGLDRSKLRVLFA